VYLQKGIGVEGWGKKNTINWKVVVPGGGGRPTKIKGKEKDRDLKRKKKRVFQLSGCVERRLKRGGHEVEEKRCSVKNWNKARGTRTEDPKGKEWGGIGK